MARYCITMERTDRIEKWFDAADDEEAKQIADQIFENTEAGEYDFGELQHDYCLTNDVHEEIVSWS